MQLWWCCNCVVCFVPLILFKQVWLSCKEANQFTTDFRFEILITISIFLVTPIPLIRQCRVAIRQACGPSNLENLNKFLEEQDETMAGYVKGVRDDCCNKLDEIKKHALLGRTAVVTNEAMTKF